MILGIENLVAGVGMKFEHVIVVVFLLAGLVFFAKSFILGVTLYFFGSAGIAMWFYTASYEWALPLIISFMSLVIMSLALYMTSRQTTIEGFT